MRIYIILLLVLMVTGIQQVHSQKTYALVIHGGAGILSPESIDETRQAEYKEILEEALLRGETLLKNGSTCVEAVAAAIMVMEDSPMFNAGKGAVFTSNGENELDASIMEGKNLNAGAVAGVKDIKNPILAARAVM